MTNGYDIPIEDVSRVARALEAAATLLYGDRDREINRHQSALVAQALLLGRVVAMRTGPANQLRLAGVLAPAAEQPADEHLIALVPGPGFLAAIKAEEGWAPARGQRDPRRNAVALLRVALDRFESGETVYAEIESAAAALRDVVSRQCCERDNDLDGNCDVHREPWRPRV